jgi:hypothetical protein
LTETAEPDDQPGWNSEFTEESTGGFGQARSFGAPVAQRKKKAPVKKTRPRPSDEGQVHHSPRETLGNSPISVGGAPAAIADRQYEEIREKLVRVLEEHAPHKVANVDSLLGKFRGREELLLQRVSAKYEQGGDVRDQAPVGSSVGPSPVDEWDEAPITGGGAYEYDESEAYAKPDEPGDEDSDENSRGNGGGNGSGRGSLRKQQSFGSNPNKLKPSRLRHGGGGNPSIEVVVEGRVRLPNNGAGSMKGSRRKPKRKTWNSQAKRTAEGGFGLPPPPPVRSRSRRPKGGAGAGLVDPSKARGGGGGGGGGGGAKDPDTRRNLDKRFARKKNRRHFQASIMQYREQYFRQQPEARRKLRVRPSGWEDEEDQEGGAPVRVFVRKRPLFAYEQERGDFDVVSVDQPNRCALVHNCLMHADMDRMHMNTHGYACDRAFNEVGYPTLITPLLLPRTHSSLSLAASPLFMF